jgi:hypothetical protein
MMTSFHHKSPSLSWLVLLLTVLAPFAATVSASGNAEDLKILALEPTVLFPRRAPLAQVARLTVLNTTGAPVVCDAVVSVRDGASETTAALTLPVNQSTVDVLVPDISAPAAVRVELRGKDGVPVAHEQAWQPQRKWKVHIIKSSHEDIGYEGYIFKKQKDIADFIDFGKEQSSKTYAATAADREASFHYTLETLLFQRNYIDERGSRAWRRLVEGSIKPGQMSLNGAPSGVHSHWMDYEELARMTYPARRESRDRYGLDLKTFMIVDNPSLSWSGAQVVAGAGFKYVARWGQGWRTGSPEQNDYATTKVPALFWWVGPDGASKVLFGWRSHYAQAFWLGQTGVYDNLINGPGKAHVSEFLKQVESGAVLGPYPYDALVTPEYIDHDIPRFDMRLLPAWSKAFSWPEIRVSSAEEFFSYIENKYGGTLPVLSGDLNNFSADYATIDPASQDRKRRAARLLPAAEGLGVIAGAGDAAFALAPARVERTYTRLFDYDEHCWPTLPEASDDQLFNANYVKTHEARRALDEAEALFGDASGALAKNIAGAGAGTWVIYNPLAHVRSGLVEIDAPAPAVTDLRTGEAVPCEPAGARRSRFLARDIPALGYALYKTGAGATAGAGTDELRAGRLEISNRYYTVRFHPENGAVTGIIDKTTGRELIDAGAPYFANQLVYVHKNGRESKDGFEYTPPKAVRMESRLAGRSAVFEAVFEDAKLGGRIRQSVTLHAGVKQVDFANRLERTGVMWSPDYKERYCDNIYFAFPFAVAGGVFRAEQPGGVVRPFDDQLRWGSHDYLYANRWVDVSNGAGGVTLAPREAGTFSFGEIRYNQFSIDYKPSKPWLFGYAWSNRMAGLLTLGPDDCNATFHYSLTSHDGGWDSGAATRFGWQTASPLLAFPAAGGGGARWREREKSFLSVDAPNVQLTVLKAAGRAGRGWIARFVETEGRATTFTLDAGALGVREAAACNLVEDDTGPLAVRNGKISVSVRPFGFATVRLLAGAPAPAPVGKITAEAVTDSTARLRWAAGAGAGDVAYNIYRSDDPGEPATVYTQVGRAAAPAFTDTGLNLATTYYYQVAAVNAANIEGPRGETLEVRTSEENTSPPGEVRGLGVIRRAPDTLIVYWQKSPEPDVARYRVFRGETADFSMADAAPLAELDATPYFLQIYRDHGLEPGKTYYYGVQPADWAGNRQPASPVAGETTPSNQP